MAQKPLFSDTSDAYSAYAAVKRNIYPNVVTQDQYGLYAAYEASLAYTQHCEKQGRPPNQEKASKLLESLVGAYVDRLASGSATGVNSQLAKGYGTAAVLTALSHSGQY